MKKVFRFTYVALTLLIGHILAPVAYAHPLGNFTINHYAGLTVNHDAVAIDYVLDMAEIPAFQEIATFDDNHNGQPDAGEAAGYHAAQCEAIRPQLDLRLGGQPAALTLASSSVEFPPGAGGLLTLRLTCTFNAPLAFTGDGVRVEFEDNAYTDRIGWREIVVTGDGVSLKGDLASTSLSHRLTAYPKDLLASPLDQRSVAFVVAALAGSGQPATGASLPALSSSSSAASRSDVFTQLITLQDMSLPTVLFALAVAFVWGALHATTPGHGKTLVGAYLVGSRGTARHALFLGLTTTITHTAGVFALGIVTLFASELIVPERLYPWLGFLSGLLVVGIGLNLFVSRLRPALPQLRLFGKVWLSSTREHSHDHDHLHDHPHAHSHDHIHDHSPEHDYEHGHDHHEDAHLLPGADGSPVTWRSLLALGISGGLLPCPSALVVLLSAIALGRTGFGLVLVLAFSFGLAGTLTAMGLLLVYTGRLLERLPIQGRVMQLIPAASALFIALAGIGITVKALMEIGVLRL